MKYIIIIFHECQILFTSSAQSIRDVYFSIVDRIRYFPKELIFQKAANSISVQDETRIMNTHTQRVLYNIHAMPMYILNAEKNRIMRIKCKRRKNREKKNIEQHKVDNIIYIIYTIRGRL